MLFTSQRELVPILLTDLHEYKRKNDDIQPHKQQVANLSRVIKAQHSASDKLT